MTSVRRIYIDSRLRTSGTDSDFTYDLSRSIEVPDNTIAFVDSVLLANVFTTLHENNNRLYVSEQVGATMTEHTYLLQERELYWPIVSEPTGYYPEWPDQDIADRLQCSI